MREALTSTSWYRVAALKPSIRRHAQFDRHEYRGQIWYVLRDPSNERSFRFTPAANFVIGLLDGHRTLQQVWELAERELGEHAPTQDELLRLLGQLHAADVLQSDVIPDTREVFQRGQRQRRAKWRQRFTNPLAIRFPLLDPERFLSATLPLVRPLFSWFGFFAWLLVVGAGAVLAGMHWSELTDNVVDRVLTFQNLLMLWAAYPLIKMVHEFGHGYAVKVWGGEVHEMGIILLVLAPIPYVEASSAAAFSDKHQRMIVGAIGIMVELLLAALALMIWLLVEPGLVRTFAFNVVLIGSISTLLFNGNPLLRFDGYYVLADTIEIPNLATRSKKYLGYLVQRYLFKAEQASSPVTAPGERAWFLIYGIASFVYRLFIVFVIVLFVSGKFFVLGLILAIWAVVVMVVYPSLKSLWFVFHSPVLQRTRARALVSTGCILGGMLGLLLLVPAPLWTRAEGVVWMPQQSLVRSEAEGFVAELMTQPNDLVRKGQPLVRCEATLQQANVRLLQSRLEELDARYMQQEFANPTRADVIRAEIESVRAELTRASERLAALVILSPTDGVFIVPNAEDLPGRFLRRGELVGYVLSPEDIAVRVVVDQEQIGLVREQTHRVDVRLADWTAEPMRASISRFVPGAADRLPTAALATEGGGALALDPQDPAGLKTLQRVFQLDLAVPGLQAIERIGNRVYVRFDHGVEPLARQWYRSLRQLFLSHFGV